MRIAVLPAIFFSAAISVASASTAETPKVITWDDLVPASEPIDNPFDGLSQEVKNDLGMVLRGKQDLQYGFVEPGSDYERILKETEQRLTEQGVDIEGLFARLEEIAAEVEKLNQQVVPDLDGQIVRLPGYALPLEMTEGGVREFLLVPYVGACIHTPPPPPNQMVYVRLDEEYVVENLYDPVWVTGRIRTEQSSRSLSFVDGQSDVATGYAMSVTVIEPYEE